MGELSEAGLAGFIGFVGLGKLSESHDYGREGESQEESGIGVPSYQEGLSEFDDLGGFGGSVPLLIRM